MLLDAALALEMTPFVTKVLISYKDLWFWSFTSEPPAFSGKGLVAEKRQRLPSVSKED